MWCVWWGGEWGKWSRLVCRNLLAAHGTTHTAHTQNGGLPQGILVVYSGQPYGPHRDVPKPPPTQHLAKMAPL